MEPIATCLQSFRVLFIETFFTLQFGQKRSLLFCSYKSDLAVKKKITPKLAVSAGVEYPAIRESVRLCGDEINTSYSVGQRL
jgi:hypothetical protein